MHTMHGGNAAPAALPPLRCALAAHKSCGVQIVRELEAGQVPKPFATVDGWRLNSAPLLTVRFGLETGNLQADLQSDDTQISARVSGDHAVVARRSIHAIETIAGWTLLIAHAGETQNDITATIFVNSAGAQVVEAGEVWNYPFVIADAQSDALAAVDDLKSTLPGKIAAVNCSAGDAVNKGDVLVVLEHCVNWKD
jgi:acetyl/propionyl-CoA carboxylase alpha subunit